MTGGLRIQGLQVRHDGQPVLSGVSLDVAEGECLCLVGASGGGKSLVAAAVAGVLPACMAATGRIRLGGDDRAASDGAGLRALWHRQSCLLPQEPGAALAPLLRAADQVMLAPPRLARHEALAWLVRFGLGPDAARRLPAELSGGMAQRLLAALAARTAARVLIVDEPTKGLDPARRAELVAVLAGLRDAGRALLVITHDLAVVPALGGRLAVLEEGRVAEVGPAGRLLADPQSTFLRACIAADPARWPQRPSAVAGSTVAAGEDLVVGRAGRRLAGPLHMALREGQVTAVLGASGQGKTTLGDTLLGLAPPAGGQVSWLGRPLDGARRRRLRPRFQKLHQDPTAVFPAGRTFGDSLSDLRRLPSGADAAARLAPLLDRMGVPGSLLARRPGEVSGGEAQRLALARLLAMRPALLVADEPCSRLDMPVQAEAMLLLRSLADEHGLSVLLISHDAAAARAVADASVNLDRPAPVDGPGFQPPA